jgi:hypothetical protein
MCTESNNALFIMVFVYILLGYCVYQGVYYRQGQKWDDGCDRRCTCDDVSKGLYSCTQR